MTETATHQRGPQAEVDKLLGWLRLATSGHAPRPGSLGAALERLDEVSGALRTLDVGLTNGAWPMPSTWCAPQALRPAWLEDEVRIALAEPYAPRRVEIFAPTSPSHNAQESCVLVHSGMCTAQALGQAGISGLAASEGAGMRTLPTGRTVVWRLWRPAEHNPTHAVNATVHTDCAVCGTQLATAPGVSETTEPVQL